MRKRTDQLGYVEEFQYDRKGNLRLYVDRNGNRLYQTYNVFGNLVYEKAENQEGKDSVITAFRYDSLGRIRQIVCDGHSYEYIYNDQGLCWQWRDTETALWSKTNADISSPCLKIQWTWGIFVKFIDISKMSVYKMTCFIFGHIDKNRTKVDKKILVVS